MRKFLAILFFGLLTAGASAQQPPQGAPVFTYPTLTTTANGNASTTITSTGVFQKVFAKNLSRKGCTIVNYSAANNMYVTEGIGTAGSTQSLAVTLIPQGSYYCQAFGTVLDGEIDISGIAADSFYAAQY